MNDFPVKQISERLTKAGKRLHERGLVVGTSGNISARIPSTDKIMIKPSGACLRRLKPESWVTIDLQGKKVKGDLPFSLETPIHLAIYKTRKDIQAIVHTHPPTATAFGIAETQILPLQIEMFIQLPNGVPVIPFEMPGSKALANRIQKEIMNFDAVILENHGIVTVGLTIEAACDLNEMVEEAAKIQFLAMSLAGKTELNLASLKKKFKTKNPAE
jgi:ribulose-5-phosphate 4-epimerase/fuculose-1-phosphate aldolase